MGGIFGGGGSTTVQATTIPPKTAEEIEMQRQSLEIGKLQLEELKRQNELQRLSYQSIVDSGMIQAQAASAKLQGDYYDKLIREMDPDSAENKAAKELSLETMKAQKDAIALQKELAPLQKAVLQKQYQDQIQGTAATAEQKALIKKSADAAIASGESDINAGEAEAIRQIREDLAPQLGLRPTDTPMLDRASLVARESVRQKGQLATNIRGAQAQAELNYPLAVQQLTQAQLQGQQSFQASITDFQNRLSQQAFQNRVALTSGGSGGFTSNFSRTGLSLGQISGDRGAIYGADTNARIAQATTHSKMQKQLGLQDYVDMSSKLMQAGGSMMMGAAFAS